MKTILFTILFVIFSLIISAQDKQVFSLLEKGTIESLDKKINELGSIDNFKNLDKAYYGALVSKKAGLYKVPKKKLSTFKEGVKYLEEAIKNDANNSEYRFLRYIIQVKSPSFLSYDKNIEEDKQFIENSKISNQLELLIHDFNKSSKKHKIQSI